MQQALQQKIDLKTKPIGSLGILENIAFQIGMIQQSLNPVIKKPVMLIFAADHGLADEGVSPFPKEVTCQMVMNFLSGGAAINVFCRQNGIDLKVVDAGVDFEFAPSLNLIHAKIARGTHNLMKQPAMSIETCQRAMEKGRELVRSEQSNGCNTIGFGEMGIGNTSSASLLMHKYTGISIEECTGRGTGHNDEGLQRKKAILKQVAEKYSPSNPLEILATFGGLEIAMMCGAMLEAHKLGMVLLVDGFITTAAFIAAHKLNPKVMENAIFCHGSEESGHRLMHQYLKVKPVVNLGMRLGEGSGVAVVFPIIQSAVNFLNQMASFEAAGVSTSQS